MLHEEQGQEGALGAPVTPAPTTPPTPPDTPWLRTPLPKYLAHLDFTALVCRPPRQMPLLPMRNCVWTSWRLAAQSLPSLQALGTHG